MDIKQKVVSTNISSIGNNVRSDSTAFSSTSGGFGGIGGIGSGNTLKYSTGINISANSFEQNTTQGVFSLKKDNDTTAASNSFGVNSGNSKNTGGSLGGVGNTFDSKQPFKSANVQR